MPNAGTYAQRRAVRQTQGRFSSLFFFCTTQLKAQSSRSYPLTEHDGNHPTPSCTDGVGPSTPGEQFSDKRERANARAAEHANIELHRLSHAACALPCKICGTPRTLAESKHLRKWAVSNENLPPTSPAKTTRRALPLSPTSSGYRASLRRLATERHAPLTVAALGLASPSRVSGKPAWCPLPVVLHQVEATRPPRLPASLCRRG